MRTPSVGLFKRVNINGTWRCCAVVTAANGRPKLDYVVVNGKPERHPEGSFVISWREGGKLKRQSVGKHGAEADAARQRQEAMLRAKANGVAVVAHGGSSPSVQNTDSSAVSERAKEPRSTSAATPPVPAEKRALAAAIQTYLSEIKSSRTAATHGEYALALRNFTDSCSKEYLEDIERIDMLAYAAYLRNEVKVSDRTCHNRFQNVQTFLKAHGITGLIKKRDWPRYVQEEPESYTEEELQKFFTACTPEERVFFEFYLMTGFRKKEVVYAAWSDVDLKQGVVRVTAKPEYHFRPKDYEEREVPIPDCPDNQLEHHYFGYMVLRPTGLATIGRSMFSPDVRTNTGGFVISAESKVHLLGYKLRHEGFPSMDQHIDISVCAHVACWAILRYYSENYSVYREYLTHDITLMSQQFNPGGLVPSKGLEVSHAERVFQAAGTFPVHVPRADDKDVSFYRQMHAYVESGFPLFAAMHAREHAIAVVGYEWKAGIKSRVKTMRYAWDNVKSIIVVDDNYLPYRAVPVSGGSDYSAKDIDAFIVALPEKIFYPADAVDRLAPTLFKLAKLLVLPPKNKTILRCFITTGSGLRSFMRNHESEFDPKLLKTVMTLPFAQFVWIVELATAEDWATGQISARAVLDATASLREVMPFWLFHSRTKALIFDRKTVGAYTRGIRVLALSGMEKTAFTRWDQNLRRTQSK